MVRFSSSSSVVGVKPQCYAKKRQFFIQQFYSTILFNETDRYNSNGRRRYNLGRRSLARVPFQRGFLGVLFFHDNVDNHPGRRIWEVVGTLCESVAFDTASWFFFRKLLRLVESNRWGSIWVCSSSCDLWRFAHCRNNRDLPIGWVKVSPSRVGPSAASWVVGRLLYARRLVKIPLAPKWKC